MDLHSALFVVPHTQGAQAWITQFNLQITPGLPLPRKHYQRALPLTCDSKSLIAAYYSFIDPERMKG